MPPEAGLKPTFTLRDAVAGDVDALTALGRKTFTDKFGHIYAPEDLSAYLDEAHARSFYSACVDDPAVYVRVAEDGAGRLCAYMLCDKVQLPVADPAPGAVELKRLYVDGAFHGMGLGSLFLDDMFAWAEAKAAPEIYLSVFSENYGAQRLYDRMGFQKVDEFWFPVGEHRDLEYLLRWKRA